MRDVRTCPDAHSLARAAADHFAAVAASSIAARRRFSVALAGGSTPRLTYELLAADKLASQLDWSAIHVFWGDERCVPPDHPDSNYLMVRETLLARIPLTTANVHRIRGEEEPQEATADYERKLRKSFSQHHDGQATTFDLVLLGMGTDGHTASLFPGSKLLREEGRWVAAHHDPTRGWRVTLTPPAINSARHVTFLVSGESKSRTLRDVLIGTYQPNRLPAQIISPRSGNLLWLLDSAAAALL
jgi:6-phosphogluconolactonase